MKVLAATANSTGQPKMSTMPKPYNKWYTGLAGLHMGRVVGKTPYVKAGNPRVEFHPRMDFQKTTLYHTISYFTILYHTIPYYTILYHTIPYYTIPYIPYYTLPYYTMLYYIILYYTILYHTILYYTILYYIILYYTILYYTILYYTVLYYTIPYHTLAIKSFGLNLNLYWVSNPKNLPDANLKTACYQQQPICI